MIDHDPNSSWVGLRAGYGGHGMPPGDTVGMQIILWNFLNMPATWARHPRHGTFAVQWADVQGVPCDPQLVALRTVDGDLLDSTAFPLDDEWDVQFGSWRLRA